MIDIFHISKLIIKKKLKVLTDSDKLQLKKFNKEYPFSKDIRIEELVDKIESYSGINKEKAWELIEIKSQKSKDKPVFVLFKKSWYKYTAAAILVGVLATTYIFKDNLFGTPQNSTPTIVNTNTIEPGTDKATLTLEDGSVVALEKGTTFQTQNANSNGEQIVYDTGEEAPKEMTYNDLTTPRAGQFHIVLSDGTEVWLNSESQLKYPVAFIEGETRQVELVYGEAYFDVSPSSEHKGAKFKVFNQSQEIEVLGTEFNIKAYNDETNVYTTLVEGVVSVEYDGKRERLAPNQQSNLDINTKDLTVVTVNVYNEISWKEGIFTFEGKSLKDITKVLSRWYDINFVFVDKAAGEKRFNGSLNKKLKINEILDIIKNFGKIKDYEINEKIIIIK